MVFTSFQKVFSRPRYIIIASAIVLSVFSFAVWLPNLRLIIQIFTSSSATVFEKVKILVTLLGSIQTNFTLFSAFTTTAIALLFGVNVAMGAFYINTRKLLIQKSGVAASFGGLISGIFGIGCATCGSFILTPLITTLGGGSLLAILPNKGGEIGLIGVGLIGYSIHSLAKKIQEPIVCKI